MKTIRSLIIPVSMLLAAGLLFATGQGEAAQPEGGGIPPTTLSWTAGGMGGGWYTTAGGMAKIINEAEPNLTIKVIPGGGMVNPVKVSAGTDDIGWGVSYIDKAAMAGTAPLFDKKHDQIAGLAGNFSVDFYQFMAAKSTGVTTFKQFTDKIKAGEKVNLGVPPAGTSDNTMTAMLLEYFGLSYKAIEDAGGKVTYAVYGDLVNLYKDRHVDYAFAVLALPGAIMTEMAISRPSTLLSVDKEVIDHFAEKVGTVPSSSGIAFVPAGTYKGIDQDIPTLAHSTEIFAVKTLSDDIAYIFAKTLMERIDEVKALHPGFQKYFTKEGAPKTVVPLHPGAERYYREAGLLE